MMKRRSVLFGTVALATLPAVDAQAAVCGTQAAHETIREQGYIPIGGIEQWVEIMGADRRNPVLLVLHGGPGSTWDQFSDLFRDWENHFTMVYWSQRGAGKTYRKSGSSVGGTMTITRMVDDGIAICEYLMQHLNKDRLFLLGHSWGSLLGVRMVQKRPALFAAYVGTGQIVSVLEGERAGLRETLRRAEAAGRRDAVEELRKLGEPPYDDIEKMVTERKWADVFDTPSDAAFNASWKSPSWYAPADASERAKVWLFSNLIMFGQKRQDGPMMAVDFRREPLAFDVPMIFIQGAEDHITPTSLVEAYVPTIAAPRKELVLLPHGGHNAIFAMKDDFLREMLRRLRGLGC